MTRDRFIARFGSIYEASPWVAERAFWKSAGIDLDDPAAVHALLKTVVDAAGKGEQLALARAHPDLAVREAEGLTAHSKAEQQGAGLSSCTAQEFAEFQLFNAAYKAKFGFPFIIAVKGLDKARILASFRARIDRDATTEFAQAMTEIHKIAQIRLEVLLKDAR